MRVRKKRSAHPVSNCHVEKEKEERKKEREKENRMKAEWQEEAAQIEERGGTVKRGRATLAMNNTGNF